MTQSATHHWLSIDCWTCELRSDTNSYRRPCSVDRTIECLFVTACSVDQYAEEKRTEKNLIVRSGISEAETTNNKRLRSTYKLKPYRHEASRGLFATAELLVCTRNTANRFIISVSLKNAVCVMYEVSYNGQTSTHEQLLDWNDCHMMLSTTC